MLYENVHVFVRFLRLFDLGTLLTSVLLYAMLRERALDLHVLSFIAVLTITFWIASESLKIYRIRRTERLVHELTELLKAAVTALGVTSLWFQVLDPNFDPKLIGWVLFGGIPGLIIQRVLTRLLFRALRSQGRDMRTCLIIGRNIRSKKIIQEIMKNPHFGMRVAQVIDFPGGQKHGFEVFNDPDMTEIPQSTIQDLETFKKLLVNHPIDEVYICLPARSFYKEIEEVLSLCSQAGITVKTCSQLFDTPQYKTSTSYIGDIPLLTQYSGPDHYLSLSMKRVFDFCFSLVGIVLFAPIHLMIILLVKLNDPKGPVFFKQQRVGLHGRIFTMVKYRTMVVDAEAKQKELMAQNECDGPAFKIKHDPRITGIGRFLRKHHLDELPQLWNVLRGEMSFVGPRPLPVHEANEKEWQDRKRLAMMPGLTSLWQIEGGHKLTFKKWMELDTQYVDNWSILLDVQILFKTISITVKGAGS